MASEDPVVRQGAAAGAITGAGVFYLQHPSLEMQPPAAIFLGAVVGIIAGSMLGHFIANKDDKVGGFFQGVGALSGLVIGLGIAGMKDVNWVGVSVAAFLGIGIGSALGRMLWWVLAVVAALIIVFSPTILRALIHEKMNGTHASSCTAPDACSESDQRTWVAMSADPYDR